MITLRAHDEQSCTYTCATSALLSSGGLLLGCPCTIHIHVYVHVHLAVHNFHVHVHVHRECTKCSCTVTREKQQGIRMCTRGAKKKKKKMRKDLGNPVGIVYTCISLY